MFLLIFLFLISITQQCKSITQTLYYYVTQNETLRLNFSTLFIGSNLTYELTEPNLQLSLPFHEQHPKTELPYGVYVLSLKAFQKNQRWLNQFAYLNQDEYYVYLSFTQSQIQLETPKFSKTLRLERQDSGLNCYDFDYFDDNSFILNCQLVEQNLLYIYTKTGKLISTIEIPANFSSKHQRIENFNGYLYVLKQSKLQSVLDIYQWNQEYTNLTLVKEFNSENVGTFLKNVTFSLKITYFQILEDRTLYFLDQNIGLFKWKDELYLEIGQFVSFHFDQFTGVVVYLSRNSIEIKKNMKILKTIKLEAAVSNESQIHISGQQIVLHYKGTYSLYNIFTGTLLQEIKPEGIVDYITAENYLIALSTEYAHLYSLSHGYLTLTGIDKKNGTFELIGKDSNSSCIVRINSMQVDEGSQVLYELDNKLPSVSTSPSHPMPIPILATGPNQQYFCTSNCEIYTMKNIEMNLNLNSNQLIYFDLKSLDSPSHYFVYQTQNLTLFYNKCELEKQLICTSLKWIQMPIKLAKENFSWQLSQKQSYFAIAISSSTLKIFSFLHENTKQIEVGQPILSFQLNQRLYIIIKGQLIIYSDIVNSEEKSIIDQLYIKSLGYELLWNPTKIFIEPTRNLLFIINNDQLLITNDIPNFSLIIAISIVKDQEIQVTFSGKTFIIIQNNKLLEYSFESQIYQIHTISLYGYELFNPLNVAYTNKYLVLQAMQNIVLVYQFEVFSHDSLKYALHIPDTIRIIVQPSFLLAASNNNNDLLLSVYHKSLELVYIFDSPQIIFDLGEFSDYLYSTVLVELNIRNEQNQICIKKQVNMLNTQTQVYISEDQLREKNRLYLNKQPQNISLEQQWYDGQAVYFNVEGEIKGVVKISNLLTEKENILDNSLNFNNFQELKNSIKLIQGASSVVLLNSEGSFLKLINLNAPLGFTCIQTVADDKFYYSLCNSDSESYIHITKISDDFPLGFQIKLSGLTQKIEILGINLFVLSDFSVKMYKLIFSGSFLLIDEVIINSQYLKLEGVLHFSDFDMTKGDINEYFFQMIDITGLMVILRGQLIDDLFQSYHRQFYQATKQLNSQMFLLQDNTQFIGIKHLFFYKNLILNIRLLLITDNAGSYAVRIIYDEITKANVDFMIFQYGYWRTNQFQVDNGIIGISYQYEDKGLIGIYQIDYTLTYETHHRYSIKCGIQQKLNADNSPQFFYLLKNVVYVKHELNQLIQYSLNEYITIEVKGGLDRQHLYITAFNDFRNTTFDYIINYNIESESSNVWWIILVSVITGAILIASIFYFYKRTHPVRSVSSILLE